MTAVLAAELTTLPYGSGGGFSPVTRVYTSGSGTETIPSGASNITIAVWGGGGGGGSYTSGSEPFQGGGGASGAYCQSTISLASANWGQTLSYVVGGAGTANNAGVASTVSNGSFGTTVSISAGGGGAGQNYNRPGVGGTASGGQSNVNGNNGGNNGSVSNPGAALVGYGGRAYGAGGLGGVNGVLGPNPGSAGGVVFYYT